MITVFLPCRAGSERVPEKNTKDFAGVSGGLLKIKIHQLLESRLIDQIVLSTNDEKVFKIAKSISDSIILDDRPEFLADSSTSTDQLINYVPTIIKEGHVLWTHTTSPFLNAEVYDSAISTYLEGIETEEFDSLMTVNKIQNFLWEEGNSYNYDRDVEKWPRTQTLKKLFEVNSGIFINSVHNYIKYNDRIGEKPNLIITDKLSSLDVDWPEDFELCEIIYNSLNNK